LNTRHKTITPSPNPPPTVSAQGTDIIAMPMTKAEKNKLAATDSACAEQYAATAEQ
jgi:hypothetical protein